MKAFGISAAIAMLALTAHTLAQDAGRGSTPPGISQDGSSASEGALKGGSIAPGETAGVPNEGKALGTPSERAVARCKDLQGTLREQCLKDAAGASTGGTRPSESATPGPVGSDPRAAPPPQNPR
jgi:hypothetical protein